MRVPNVSPASDEHSCREMPLYEWWEKCRRVRKEGVLHLEELLRYSIRLWIDIHREEGGEFYFLYFCASVNRAISRLRN